MSLNEPIYRYKLDSDMWNFKLENGEIIKVEKSHFNTEHFQKLLSFDSHIIELDNDRNIILPFNSYCFKKILEYLRYKSMVFEGPVPYPQIDELHHGEFEFLVSYLGLNDIFKSNIDDVIKYGNTVLDDLVDANEFGAKESEVGYNLKNVYLLGFNRYNDGKVLFKLVLSKLPELSDTSYTFFIGMIPNQSIYQINSLNGCYGWSDNDCVYVNGVPVYDLDGYYTKNDLKENDKILLLVDFYQSKILFKNLRNNKCYVIRIRRSMKDLRLFITFNSNEDFRVELNEVKILFS